MKKVPNAFVRDMSAPGCPLTREPNPACSWLFEPEALQNVTPTRKWDGTACMVRNGILYVRYDAKHGKTPPPGFEPCQEPDTVTGHWPGWIRVTDEPRFVHHRDAWSRTVLADGTYELCGPKVGANPEGFEHHVFVPHGQDRLPPFVVSYDSCARVLSQHVWEGIVFHHRDGRMAKVRRPDFGLPWGRKGV